MPPSAPFSTDPRDREAALALLSVRGVGPVTLTQLQQVFGTLSEAMRAPPSVLREHLRAEARQSILEEPSLTKRLDETLARLHHHHAAVLFRGDPNWPGALADLGPGEPLALFIRGNLRLDQTRVSVVGSREADPYGLRRARGLGVRLAESGLATVSGGARGVDTEAHVGALQAKGASFAVLGSGFDFPFPPANGPLFDRLAAEGGAVITELPPRHEPKQGTFPRRNQVVAALGAATIVVRGDTQSGALLTAIDAHRLGRALLAVPGQVDEAQSRGAHLLLRLGWARPCCDFADVLAALGLGPAVDETALARHRSTTEVTRPETEPLTLRPAVTAPTTGVAADIWAALGAVPVHFDDLASSTGLSVPRLSAALTQMEVAGQIVEVAGKRFARRSA